MQVKLCILGLIFVLTCQYNFAQVDPALTDFSPAKVIASGSDPDVAVSADGTVYVCYTRSGKLYLKKGTYQNFGDEIQIGTGVDPAVAVSPDNNIHVFCITGSYAGSGSAYYYSSTNRGTSFSGPRTIFSGGSFRKPRIAAGPDNRVCISISNRATSSNRVRIKTITGLTNISEETVAGQDNNGGLDVDNTGTAHLTWRSSNIYYNYFQNGTAGSSKSISSGAGDFSDIAVDRGDNSIHVAGVVRSAGGIYYIQKGAGGSWSSAKTYAASELSGAEADNVCPAVAVTSKGRAYITFSGTGMAPYFFVIDEKGNASSVIKLGSLSQGKYKNGNIHAAPGDGVYIAWSTSSTVALTVVGQVPGQVPIQSSIHMINKTDPTFCYPNPFRTRIMVKRPEGLKDYNSMAISVYNMGGQHLFSKLLNNKKELIFNREAFDRACSGAYIIRIEAAGRVLGSQTIFKIK